MRKRKFCRKKIVCHKKDFAPQVCKTKLKKDWNIGVNCLYKLEETWLGFKEIEKGIGSANLPPWITWLLLYYFFNNKRHRNCFLLFSAEKRGYTILKQSHYDTVYLFLFRIVPPPLQLFPSSTATPAGFFHPLVLASPGQLGLYECHLLYTRSAVASKTILAREWMCTFCWKKTKGPFKGWDFTS